MNIIQHTQSLHKNFSRTKGIENEHELRMNISADLLNNTDNDPETHKKVQKL